MHLERSGAPGEVDSKIRTNGEMNRAFKFPNAPVPSGVVGKKGATHNSSGSGSGGGGRKPPPEELAPPGSALVQPPNVITPSSIEVPPPPPIEKEKSVSSMSADEGEEELGDTVDIPLN